MKFDLKVKFDNGPINRRPNGPQVADAVQVALANAKPTPYPLGNGLSIAGPVKSVSGSTNTGTGRRLQEDDTETFTITVVALGPLLQPISKVVRDLDFINAVRDALVNAGQTSIYGRENAPAARAATLAAEKMGSPFKAADFTVTAVQNADGTWSMNVEVDAGDNAVAAADKLSATTSAELGTALDRSVNSVAPATVTADNTISWSFDVELRAPIEVVGEDKFSFALKDAPSPSPPRSNQANLDADNTGSNISDKEAESLGGGIIFLIILLLLCFLCPLLCCCFARGRYGPGKERLYFKFKLSSHSHAPHLRSRPFTSRTHEDREKMRVELYTKSSDTEKQDTSVLDDDEHI